MSPDVKDMLSLKKGRVYWTWRRKAEIVRQVSSGDVPRVEALARYGLSEEQLAEWERRFASLGAQALLTRNEGHFKTRDVLHALARDRRAQRSNPVRWTYRRKAEVVRQVRSGDVPRLEALDRYGLSEDELAEWERRFAAGGAEALLVKHRESDSAAPSPAVEHSG